MAISEELERLIRGGREGPGIEFKASMNWSAAATKAKVIKSALALANNHDGRVLVFGVERRPNEDTYAIVGMSDDDLPSFTQEGIAAKVNAHATPQIDLRVERGEI